MCIKKYNLGGVPGARGPAPGSPGGPRARKSQAPSPGAASKGHRAAGQRHHEAALLGAVRGGAVTKRAPSKSPKTSPGASPTR